MHKTLYERITDRWKEKANDYAKVNRNREVITQYFRSDEIVDTDDKGRLVGEAIYNGSPSWFSRMMATGFQGSLVSKNISWFRYQMEQYELKGLDLLDIWLQEVKQHMAGAYQRGNFYDVQPQFTHDGLTTGSPVLFGEEDINERKTMWMPQHFKTVRVYYSRYNEPEGVITEDKTWTAKKIIDTFVPDDDELGTKRREKLSVAVNAAIDQNRFDDVFTVYRATFKADDPIWNGQGEDAFVKPSGDWRWLSAYFLELSGSDKSKMDKPLNDNMGDFSQPFAIWNFDKTPWECSSRTPAFYAMWDNLSLQQIDKNYIENIQNANRPAMMALDSMAGKLQLGPEGEMLVTQDQYDRPPVPIDKVGALEFSKDLIDMKVEALKRWFYIDRFAMFSDLAMQKNQPVTATQIWQMAGEKATLLSPAIETHSTYLVSIDSRMIDIESRAGRGPFDPDVMGNIIDIIQSNIKQPVSTISIRPVYIGPLAQAQKASQTLEPIQSGIQAMLPLAELFPDLPALAIKEWETLDDIFQATDFPQKNFVSKEDYEKAKAAMQEARAKTMQAELAIEAMKASKAIQGPVDENSVMAQAAEVA